ncbi:GNAT family N-acetyltransferase [Leuconostoc mesenteroides]|uniref:GNAT family N-acetyltransferase n=1 Tax=Leuconostoc mesenteroides TaxID=1245 RepID=UPI001CBDF94F|nr:GNAT family N-acetyltransferase [Leuconostoc mesenteroides]
MRNNVEKKKIKKQNVMQKYDLITKEPIFQKFKTNNKQLYKQNIDLRNAVLRKPLKKLITLDEMMVEQNNQFYGITINDILVATFSSYPKDSNTVRLVSFAVDAQHQQQRLGSRLLSWAIDDFCKQGYYRVSLSARASAHNFYLKQGFKDTREPQINHYLNVVDFEMQYIIPTRN